MLIIIEGMDKTGKSTLCNYLLKNLPDAFLLKNGEKPKDDSKEERDKIKSAYEKIFDAYSSSFKNSVLIVDRFLISEFVYSYKRGYEAMKDRELLDMIDKLYYMNALIIYCNVDKKIIEKKFIEDKEDYTKVEEIEYLLKRYDISLSLFEKIPKITYNYTITTPEQVARKIKQMIEAKKNEY